MRYVYPGREVPHKWIHQTQDSARGGNISFEGTRLYSYRACIAELYPARKGLSALVLISEHRYSVTTAKHINYAWRAIPDSMRTMYVPHPSVGLDHHGNRTDKTKAHRENFDFLTATAARLLKEAQRAMTRRAVEWREGWAEKALSNATFYSGFFGLRRKVPDFPAEAWAAAHARVERIANPDPKSLDKRERAAASRKQAEYATRRLAEINREIGVRNYGPMAMCTDWRLAGAFGAVGASGGYFYGYREGGPMLRLTPDSIETSQGASIPRADASRLWRIVERVREGGHEWTAPTGGLGGIKAGDFPVDRIDADGSLHVGCHHIPHVELRTIARALGFVPADWRPV